MHLSLWLNQLGNLLILNLRDCGMFSIFEKAFDTVNPSILYVFDKFNSGNEIMCMNGLSNREQFASVNSHNSISLPVPCGVCTSNIHSRTSLVLILPHCHVTGDYMRYACACTGHLLRCCRVVRSPSSKSLPILKFLGLYR